MKAIVCDAPSFLAVRERPKPQRGEGEVLVRINRVGLCGTDFHTFDGNQPFLSYPIVMGHELAGEVAEVGPESQLPLGALVTINPYRACGGCIACRKGKPNCCVNIQVLGVHTDGGMTEYLCVPEHMIIRADGLTPDQAAMVEFLSIGAHAVRRAAVVPGERVLVVGGGPIGIAAALFARFAGADVSLIDTQDERVAYVSQRLGFERTAVAGPEVAQWLAAQTDGEFYDIVFDATGSARAIEAGFGYVAHGGKYVLISVVKGGVTFEDPEFHKREMQLIGSRNATNEDFQKVIDYLRTGRIPAEALLTHRFPLIDAPQAMSGFKADRARVLKAVGYF
ncbi:MAG: zinc-binding alcohol dehydrogenase family protein [Asticcacaulis sp.]|uniref:zinc-binding alcohol dehydrogenase family protein n=1 Tax=Asticcacaulis sp. TaxID=1872648 RepID=UPI0039E3A6FC